MEVVRRRRTVAGELSLARARLGKPVAARPYFPLLATMALVACARQPRGGDAGRDRDGAADCRDELGATVPCAGLDGGLDLDSHGEDGMDVDAGPVSATSGGIVGVCTVGQDRTCNADPVASDVRGKCLWDGSCSCTAPNALLNSQSGKCFLPDDMYGGGGCEYAGVSYRQADTFPCLDGCGTCKCGFVGDIETMSVTCPGGVKSMCGLDASYSYTRWGGGPGAPRYDVGLEPALASPRTLATYTIRRNYLTDWSLGCAPALPACGDPRLVDLADIMADIMDPAVQKALSDSAGGTASWFGIDPADGDGPGFAFSREAGGFFDVGAPCNGAAGCKEIPPAIAKLVGDLRALEEQQLASPSCAVLSPSYFPCGRTACRTNLEYCARAEFDGVERVAKCRPYPAGCAGCDCALEDAASVLETEVNCPPVEYRCSDGSNQPVKSGPVPTLRVQCTIA